MVLCVSDAANAEGEKGAMKFRWQRKPLGMSIDCGVRDGRGGARLFRFFEYRGKNEVRPGDWSLGLFRTGCVGDKTPNRIEEYDRMKLKNTTE